MPYKRGNTFYVKRRLPGIDRKVYKSLGTTSSTRAASLERMILTLCEKGHFEPVRAWLDDQIQIHELAEAFEGGKMPELMVTIRTQSIPLAVGFDQALEAKEPDVRTGSSERYRASRDNVLRVALSVLGASVTVQQALDATFIQKFKAVRLDEHADKSTINKDVQAISLLATYALEREWITKRPKIRRYKVADRMRYLESDQIPPYMAALRRPFRSQFELLLGTGMRLGETEGTRVCDIKFGRGECRILLTDAKTPTGVRPVFVPPWCADSLAAHIAERGLSGTDQLFTIPRRTVQKEHDRACMIVGITDYRVHDHRHSAAVHLARSGMPLHLLQQQLGHARIQQTMKYARFHPEYSDVSEYFEAVGRDLGLASPHRLTADEQMSQAAELLGVDVSDLGAAVGSLLARRT